jgi:hypothetical protein
MTVAQIREPIGADYMEAVFLESARFYRVLKANPAYGEILRRLREAEAKGRVVTVQCASSDSDIIDGVQPHGFGGPGIGRT